MYDTWIGKRVVIIQTDRFRKFGVFVSHDATHIFLKYYSDGTVHPISKSLIFDIVPDRKTLGVSK